MMADCWVYLMVDMKAGLMDMKLAVPTVVLMVDLKAP